MVGTLIKGAIEQIASLANVCLGQWERWEKVGLRASGEKSWWLQPAGISGD